MNKLKSYLLMAGGIAILAAVVSGIVANPAIAQIDFVKTKSASVKDVDRSERIFVSFGFREPTLSYRVPVGKVLVIEWVSASPVPAGGQYTLGVSGDADTAVASNHHEWSAYFSPVPGSTTLYQQTRLYAKAGQTIEAAFINTSRTLFMQGYLIDDSVPALTGGGAN
jgi:hypothetical protein